MGGVSAMRAIVVAVMLMQAPSVTITPPLVAGETFRVEATHVIKYYSTSDGTIPCASTPPGPNCVADTTSYQLQMDGKVIATQAASTNVGNTVSFTVTGGVSAGTHTATVDAVGSSTVPSTPITFVVDPLPVPAPSLQGAPLVQIPSPMPPAQWTEQTALRASRSVGSVDPATLAYPGTVPAGTRLIIAGSTYAQPGATSIAVTGTGTGCAGLTFAVRFNTATPSGTTWRTFIAHARTTVAGPCTISLNPSGTSAALSWSQTGFTGPSSVKETANACPGTSTAPTCSLLSDPGMLVIGVMSHQNQTMTITPGAGLTQIGENEDNASSQAHSTVYLVQITTGTAVVNWNLGSSSPWGVQLLGLR